MKKEKKLNVINFPLKLTDGEREVEAIIFAAAEPLDVDTIESKIDKKETKSSKSENNLTSKKADKSDD